MPAAAKSYYDTLSIVRKAGSDDIGKAFRKLSLKWHPERASGPKAEAEVIFGNICEAYDVLSNPARRAIYDQYGERGLKNGVPDGNGGVKGGKYRFGNNSADIFAAFFGTSSPFADILGAIGEEPPEFYGSLTGMQLPYTKSKPRPIVVQLEVTLAEVFNGAMKKVTYSRKKLADDGVTFDELVESRLYVQSGWEEGLVATLPGMGDEGVHLLPGDVEVEMVVLKDGAWSRDGRTLHYAATVSLAEALTGSIVEVATLDGRLLSVPITQVVSPGQSKLVPGEGMPAGEEGAAKGDLVIDFNIAFPTTLSLEQKAQLKKTLA